MASVTRLGDFRNFLATNLITKVAQMFGHFLGSCKIRLFKVKLVTIRLGQLLCKLGLLFISASGHIAYGKPDQSCC